MKELLSNFHWNDHKLRFKKIGLIMVEPFSLRIVNQKLEVNSAIPGLSIQCSTDGGKSWSDIKDGMTVSGRVVLGTR